MMKTFALILSLLILIATPAASVERQSVQVVCQLAEHRYRINLTATEIKQIESDCATELADTLKNNIGFLDFVAGDERDNKLVIRIGKTKDEADPNAIRAVNFEIEVTGTQVTEPSALLTWTFRSVDEFLLIPSAATFVDAIRLRFAEALQTNEQQLVEEQLGRLIIADSAYPMPTEQSWLLPFSREELGIADNTEFKIRAALFFPSSEERFTYTVMLFGDFTSDSSVPPEFHHALKALQLGDDKLSQADSIQRLQNAQDVQVKYVVVSRYVPMVAPQRTPPSDLTLNEPGGP